MTLKNVLKNALISYIIISVDLFADFETNFNVTNWSGIDFVGYIVVFLFALGMDIYFEKKKEIILSDLDVSNDIGNEINAKINLSRSLIEMEQIDEARRLLEEVLKENLNSNDQSVANDLLESIK